MRQITKLSVRGKLDQRVVLEIHPQMTTKELTELVMSSTILHNGTGHIPVRLVSSDDNLLIDYMLSDSRFTIQDLQMAVETFECKMVETEFYLSKDHKVRSNYPKILVDVDYKQTELKGQDLDKIWRYQQHLQENSIYHLQTQCVQSIVYVSQTKQFERQLVFSKEYLSNFDKVESILILKHKLIKLSECHTNVFGKFKKIKESAGQIIFGFKYIPSIPLINLLQIPLPRDKIELLINNIWLFLLYIRNNDISSCLNYHIETNNVQGFLSKINSDIFGQLTINDLIHCWGTQAWKGNKDQCMFLEEIKTYCNRRMRQNQFNRSFYEEGIIEKNKFKVLTLKQFCRLFCMKKYVVNQIIDEKYIPSTKQFTWSIPTIKKDDKNIQEKSTQKKKRSPSNNPKPSKNIIRNISRIEKTTSKKKNRKCI